MHGFVRRRRIARLPEAAMLGALAWLAAGVAPAAAQAANGPTAATGAPGAAPPYAAHVADAARRFGISEAWIRAVMRAESGGDPQAISPAGALGLMQIMPATWAALTKRHRLGDDPFDVRANIFGGAAYLREMWDRYGDVGAMLAAYNAGPGRADDHRIRGRPLPLETIAYVARVSTEIDQGAAVAPARAPASHRFAWRHGALFVAATETLSTRRTERSGWIDHAACDLFVGLSEDRHK